MSESDKEIVPLPPNLKRLYTPKHEVTKSYVVGMTAIDENRIEDGIALLEAECDDSPCRGLALGNAGLALLRLEKFGRARKRLLEADNHFDKHGCPHPPSWVQFARNYVETIALSRPQEALQEFNRAIATARELAKKHENFRQDIELEIAHTFNSWGGTLIRLESPDAALDCFQSGRDIYQRYESENKAGLAETLTNVSLALRGVGKKYEAALALQEALGVAKLGGDQDQVRRIEIATIQLDPTLIEGDPLKLLDYAAKEAIADGRHSTGYVRQCIRATVAESLGKASGGLAACEDARAIEDLLDSGDSTPANMRLVLARLRGAAGRPASEVLEALFEGARLWWDVLRQPQLTADVLVKTQSMHDHFRLLTRKLLNEGKNDEACMAFEAGRALGFAIEVDQFALPAILALDPFSRSQPSLDCAGLQSIQVALCETEVVISMAILPPDFVAFVVRKESVTVIAHRLPDDNDCRLLFDSIRRIPRRLHKKEGIGAVPLVIQEFGQKIFNEIGASSVVSILPNSILHGVPWRALLRSFGMNWSQLSAVTGFGMLLARPKLTVVQGDTIALGHGTAGSINLNQEARNFANVFGDHGSVMENATSSHIRSTLSRCGIVLISCHGRQREDLNSGIFHLYLSLGDGDKSADEVWPDVVVSNLVVLSACDSGVYEVAWGDYPLGSGPDLLRKGAKLCLATRFPVDAQFAATLMQEFAIHLASGDSVNSSLSKALDTVENGGADFWNDIACFELIG
ncbi:MAG: CHAT domain-containing protein [Verrucomicrobiaceae bacterium]